MPKVIALLMTVVEPAPLTSAPFKWQPLEVQLAEPAPDVANRVMPLTGSLNAAALIDKSDHDASQTMATMRQRLRSGLRMETILGAQARGNLRGAKSSG